MLQSDVLADVIVQTVKAALAPVLERIAAAEARIAAAAERDQAVAELRERLVSVETKQAMPAPMPAIAEPLDLAPLMERVAATEARVDVLGDLRDRLVVVETKQAPPSGHVDTPEPIDVGPLAERIAASEARLEVLGDLRDRVVVIETKSAMPPAILETHPDDSASELRDRIVALETRMAEPASDPAVPELRDRLITLEAKSALPVSAVPVSPPDLSGVTDRLISFESKAGELRDRLVALETKTLPPIDLGDVPTRLSAAELRLELDAAERRPLVTGLSEATKDIGTLRERVAVLEVRAPIPGPPGDDGLGFDDLDFIYDEFGRLSLKFVRGDVVKTARVPGIVDRGVYESGEVYLKGDGATFGNSFWIAQRDTSAKPGEEPGAWRLSVRAGRDGRDARYKPEPTGLPVVKS